MHKNHKNNHNLYFDKFSRDLSHISLLCYFCHFKYIPLNIHLIQRRKSTSLKNATIISKR